MIKRAPFAKWRFPTCPKRKIRGKLRANRGIRYFPRRIILPLPSPPPPQVTNLPSKIYLGAVREEFKAWGKIIDLDLFNFRRLWCCFVRQDIKYDKGGMKKDSNRLLYTDIFKKKVSNLKEERCTRMLERGKNCIHPRSKNFRFDFELEVA